MSKSLNYVYPLARVLTFSSSEKKKSQNVCYFKNYSYLYREISK